MTPPPGQKGDNHPSRGNNGDMVRSGPSATAVGVAALRALYSAAPPPLGIVRDPFAVELLPRSLQWLLRAAERKSWVATSLHRTLAWATSDLTTNLPLRTAAIDEAVAESVSRGARQMVVLGSGLDARAWRMPELESVSVYELDLPGALHHKKRRLGSRRVRARTHHFIPTDFERESLGDLIRSAGFLSHEPSLWIWEGVTIYLTRAAIQATLDVVCSLSAPGSTLIVTYTQPNLGQQGATAHLRMLAACVGEPLHGEVHRGELRRRLEHRSFRIVSDEGAHDWVERFWPASAQSHGSNWERLVVARRVPLPAGAGPG